MAYVIFFVVIVAGITKSKLLVLLALIFGAPVVYALSCWLDPWTDCLCCKGTGKHYRYNDKKKTTKFHHCRLCRKNRGAWLRPGRRLWNYYKRRSAAK